MIELPHTLFPARPMKATRSVFSGAIVKLFSGILLLAVTAFVAIWQVPGIWRDIQINQNPIEVNQFNILDGECRSQRVFFTTCEADLSYTYEGKTIESHTSFAFVDFSTSDYYVGVVISADRPAMATLDLGLNMLWNRIAVAGVLIVLVGGIGLAALWGFFSTISDNRRTKRGSPVTPVALEVTNNKKVFGGRTIAYRAVTQGKRRPAAAVARFGKAEEPIWLNGSDGEVYAVGARIDGLKHPVLLDETLNRLDFTEEERADFNAALDEGSASHQAEAAAQ